MHACVLSLFHKLRQYVPAIQQNGYSTPEPPATLAVVVVDATTAPGGMLPSCRRPNICVSDDNCVAPEWCIFGRCSPPVESGQLCQNDSHCAGDLTCINKFCVARVSSGSTCNSDYDCVVDDIACIKKVCTLQVNVGEACDSDFDCVDIDISCIDKVCQGSGVVGDVCSDTTECRAELLCLDEKCGKVEKGGAC
jgi:hypothetical protein